jgi:hypothetical protein
VRDLFHVLKFALSTPMMRTRVVIQAWLLIGLLFITLASRTGLACQSDGYGPEVKSFLQFLQHEDTELEYQIKHNEITRKDYVRSKNRNAIHRETVLNIVRETGEDIVPELHVVAATEVNQLIEDGANAVKHIKRGAVIADKWRYVGSVMRGELFYIFERVSKN